MRKQPEEDFSFMSYAPILFISAKTGQRLDKLFETIQHVDVQNGTRIPTGALNEMLARSTARVCSRPLIWQAPQDFLYHPKLHPPANICCVRQPESVVPFFLPALYRKPDSGKLWPDRYTDAPADS